MKQTRLSIIYQNFIKRSVGPVIAEVESNYKSKRTILTKFETNNIMHLSMLSPRGGGPRAYVGHLTFQKNF